jgi:hypothetical protein
MTGSNAVCTLLSLIRILTAIHSVFMADSVWQGRVFQEAIRDVVKKIACTIVKRIV